MIQRNLQEVRKKNLGIHLQRFDNSNKPLSTMKIMSLGDIISGLLANPITRQDLEYRHNYDNREEDELSGKIVDVFDGNPEDGVHPVDPNYKNCGEWIRQCNKYGKAYKAVEVTEDGEVK